MRCSGCIALALALLTLVSTPAAQAEKRIALVIGFTGILKEAGVKISMDGKGRWMDNVFIERLWRSKKSECVYLYALFLKLRACHSDLG
jgi:hypothetical protein